MAMAEWRRLTLIGLSASNTRFRCRIVGSRSSAQGHSVALPKQLPAALGRGDRELSRSAAHVADWDRRTRSTWSIQAPFPAAAHIPHEAVAQVVVCISLRLHPRWRSSVIGVPAIINCSCAFHFIEQCALPKLLAVLVGKWEAIRFISDV